jgi:hypothetical protein
MAMGYNHILDPTKQAEPPMGRILSRTISLGQSINATTPSVLLLWKQRSRGHRPTKFSLILLPCNLLHIQLFRGAREWEPNRKP